MQTIHERTARFIRRGYELPVFEEDEYVSLILECIEYLRPEITVHRITGDGPKDLLIAPLWSSKKRSVLNHIHHEMKEKNCWQGKALE